MQKTTLILKFKKQFHYHFSKAITSCIFLYKLYSLGHIFILASKVDSINIYGININLLTDFFFLSYEGFQKAWLGSNGSSGLITESGWPAKEIIVGSVRS